MKESGVTMMVLCMTTKMMKMKEFLFFGDKGLRSACDIGLISFPNKAVYGDHCPGHNSHSLD